MGMKARLAFGAVVGLAVIGAVSATAGSHSKAGGSGHGARAGSSPSASHKPGGAGENSGGSADSRGAQAAGKKKTAFGDNGDYRVGTDIEPGTYRTIGNPDDTCYWERARDASGQPEATISGDRVNGTGYVTVMPTDKVFRIYGCTDWELVDPTAPTAKGTPATSMDGDAGMFKVGTDIAPGTYKSTGNTSGSCYWERTKDAEHRPDSFLANDHVTGTAVVTISASDGYFKTDDCGDWKKI